MVVPIGAYERAEVCSASGLNIIASASQRIYRVAQTSYGALNPPVRPEGSDPSGWSRWDTPGRTVYGGSTPVGAFVEVLEYILPDPPATPLSELFDDVEQGEAATLAEQIARELPGHGAMPYRSIPRGWRTARSLYEMLLPEVGWFVDVTGAESISVIDRELRPLLVQCGVEQLTLSELMATSDEMKPLTTGIATWVRREVVLHDGSIPHGIVYPSSGGARCRTGRCGYAVPTMRLASIPSGSWKPQISGNIPAAFRKQQGCVACESTNQQLREVLRAWLCTPASYSSIHDNKTHHHEVLCNRCSPNCAGSDQAYEPQARHLGASRTRVGPSANQARRSCRLRGWLPQSISTAFKVRQGHALLALDRVLNSFRVNSLMRPSISARLCSRVIARAWAVSASDHARTLIACCSRYR